MAKTINPLFSISASGKLGKAIGYRNFKNKNVVNFSACKSARKKYNHNAPKQNAINFFSMANLFYNTRTTIEIESLYQNYTVENEHPRNSIFRVFIKKKPTITGLAFFGDNNLGEI